MACGELNIRITPPTAGANKSTQEQLDYQIDELDHLITERAMGLDMTEGTRSFLQSLADAQVRHFDWLDGGVVVELCDKEAEPVTMTLELRFQQRKKARDGEWSSWEGWNLGDTMEGLSSGDVIQRRMSGRGNHWQEGPEMVVIEDESGELDLALVENGK